MQLHVVIDCFFRAIGPQMELMLHTEVPHTSQCQRYLYHMLDVLANAEEDCNHYHPNLTQADDDYLLQINNGDNAPEYDADNHADNVSSQQTEIDNAACNNADGDIVAFDYEDDYVNYLLGLTSH
ncbi:hypothetical protein H4S08_004086 [Coemansia sp. RSA 1365]|nr:hypothetical protein H4S08_004086 [Coemansia sp. RSA 1365]